MKERIEDKISDIEEYIGELRAFFPNNFEEYKGDIKIRAASERYFEKIVEAIVDLAFLIRKERNLKIPENDEVVFDILSENKIISQDVAKRLKEAKSMRNLIIHQYKKVEDIQVFTSISEEIIVDAEEFIKLVRIGLK